MTEIIARNATIARERGTARIAIRDDGEGFAAERTPTLFQRGCSTRAHKSGGLGLHRCANAIAMHGGLKLESEGPGRGAVAVLTLAEEVRLKRADRGGRWRRAARKVTSSHTNEGSGGGREPVAGDGMAWKFRLSSGVNAFIPPSPGTDAQARAGRSRIGSGGFKEPDQGTRSGRGRTAGSAAFARRSTLAIAFADPESCRS